MQRLFLVVVMITMLCCRNDKKAIPDEATSETLQAAVDKKIKEYLFNFDSVALGKVLDSLKPFAKSVPDLTYWLMTKAQQQMLEMEYDSARIYLRQAKDISYQEDSVSKDLIGLLSVLSGTFIFEKRWDSALHYGLEAYFLAQKHDSISPSINIRLFQIYSTIGDRENARKYIFEGWDRYNHTPYWRVFLSAGIAKYYDDISRPDSAILFWEDIIKDTTIYSKEAEASKYANYGLLLANNNRPQEGITFLLKALSLYREIQKLNGVQLINTAIAYNKNNQYKNSLAYLDSALKYINPAKEITNLRLIWRLRSENQLALKQYERAFASIDTAYNLFQREIDSSIAQNARELEIQYRVREKEEKISSLAFTNEANKKIRSQQRMIIFSMIALMLLLAVIVMLLLRRRKMQIQLRDAEIKQQLLRSQMQSHFVFNSFGVLQSYIRNANPDKSLDYLNKFSRVLRLNLENANRSFVPLSDEIEGLKNYLSVQAMNFENRFDYQITVEGYADENEDIMIPPMLLQPFVENAIFHGVLKKEEKGYISIQIEKKEHSLHCIIEDNGVGLLSQSGERKRSLSTGITKERLAVLGRQTGKPAGVNVMDKEKHGEGTGVRVQLDIPYE